jgi:peptide deformylase
VPEAPILRYPHPLLKQRCRELSPADEPALVARAATDLVDTMRGQPRCVGLAAPQIGDALRLVAVDCTGHKKADSCHGLLVLVNPVIVHAKGDELGREGCLSIPDLTANVRRATTVTVEALTPEGEPVALEANAFEARVLQHELDHLDGILFPDRVTDPATLCTWEMFRAYRQDAWVESIRPLLERFPGELDPDAVDT